ncbi:MAG: EamA family transporter [Silicimonas sp.]|nr:EamA family transporter [Silicimonas sp.]
MTVTVFFAVLGAALLHAGWNALVRIGASKTATMTILTIVQAGLGLGFAMTMPWPGGEVWAWLLASGILHAAYKLFLAFAYEKGDLSRVYPIARGAAPLIVLGVSVALLREQLSLTEVGAILVLGFGILCMGLGAFRSGEARGLVPLALASATMTAGYSLVDGLGARVAGDAALFVAWLFVFDGLFFMPIIIALRGPSVLVASVRGWAIGAAAAVLSYGAYAVAVWAMTEAPIALVTALRETSILFAMLIGWVLLGERMDHLKLLSGTLILAGVVLARL